MWRKRKTGKSIIVEVFLVICLIMSFIFIDGVLWLGDKILPTLLDVSAGTVGVLIIILLPLSIYRKTRSLAGNGMIISSWIFAVTLWFWCFSITHSYWGTIGVYIGLFFLGIGIVPLAVLSDLIKGNWAALFELLFLAGLIVGSRLFGIDLKESYADFRAKQSSEKAPPAQHEPSPESNTATIEDDKENINTSKQYFPEREEANRGCTEMTELGNEELRYARVLGLEGNITPSNIKQAYHDMINKYHPNKIDDLGDEFKVIAYKKTHEIITAYEYFCKKFNVP